MKNKILITLVASLVFTSMAFAQWQTNRLLAVTAFGSVPASCTLIGTVSKNAKEILIFNTLNNPVTISTSATCAAASSMEILASIGVALDVYKESNTSGVALYYKYTSSAPTSGSIAISYVTDR